MNEASLLADEASPLTDEASPLTDEASPLANEVRASPVKAWTNCRLSPVMFGQLNLTLLLIYCDSLS